MEDELKSELRGGLAEFLATLLFVYCGCCSVVGTVVPVANDVVSISLTFGFAIVVLVAAFADISGGHINPAVTWALIISKNVTLRRGLIYIIAQLVGGVCGAALLRASTGDRFSDKVGTNFLQDGLDSGEGVILEAVFTFILVSTVFHVAVARPGAAGGAVFAPLSIGLAVAVAHLCTVRLTGTGINPARSFGPAVIQNEWDDHWVYWVGPLIGSTLAVAVVYVFYGSVKADEIVLSGGDALDLDGRQSQVKAKERSSSVAEERKDNVEMTADIAGHHGQVAWV